MKHIYVISVFPELIRDFINYGVLKKGQDKSLINIEASNKASNVPVSSHEYSLSRNCNFKLLSFKYIKLRSVISSSPLSEGFKIFARFVRYYKI